MRFPDKPRHQLFIEPCGLDTEEMYLQGMSSSLPEDVQIAFYHTIPVSYTHLVVYVKKNRNQGLRVGITTSKKIGNAVLRNGSRRVIREAFREMSIRDSSL